MIGRSIQCHWLYISANTTMKTRMIFSTLFCLILVSIIFAQGDITPSHSRRGNEITFNCEYFGMGEIRIRVVSFHADGSNDTEIFVDGSTRTTEVATFTVTPSDEKAAYCEVGGGTMSTDLVYFGGEYDVRTLYMQVVLFCNLIVVYA